MPFVSIEWWTWYLRVYSFVRVFGQTKISIGIPSVKSFDFLQCKFVNEWYLLCIRNMFEFINFRRNSLYMFSVLNKSPQKGSTNCHLFMIFIGIVFAYRLESGKKPMIQQYIVITISIKGIFSRTVCPYRNEKMFKSKVRRIFSWVEFILSVRCRWLLFQSQSNR